MLQERFTNYCKGRVLFILLMCFFCLPQMTKAAVFYFEGAGQYHQGDIFIVQLRMDPEGECINAVEAHLSFPPELLAVQGLGIGQSLISFWPQEPQFSNEEGMVSFTGGIPGGYCGELAGNPGRTNLLLNLALHVKESPTLEGLSGGRLLFLPSSRALLNDGLGTIAHLDLQDFPFSVLPVFSGERKDEWQDLLKSDTTPPEPFEVVIKQDKTLFNGKFFLIFSTTDRQSGLDFYQVKEGASPWRGAASPYVLEEQDVRGIIKVRAVDKAGNERIATAVPLAGGKTIYWLAGLVIIAIIGSIGAKRWLKKSS